MKNLRVFCILCYTTILLLSPTLSAQAETADSEILPWRDTQKATIENWPAAPETTSEGAILMEASTGTILYGKNIDTNYYPASITKILTTLLALEHCSLDEVVTFSHDAVFSIERGSSHIGINEGEELTVEQCLYAIMLASANECSYALGEHIGGGDYSKFITMMNEKAAELGCTNSKFSNAHGLPDEEHYTTAYDYALISKEAIKNETFQTITGTYSYTIPPTNLQPEPRTFQNHHKMLSASKFPYDGCLGGKTGFTTVARNTLVTYAERNDVTLICVLLMGNGQETYTDTAALLDYGFENFTKMEINTFIKDSDLDYASLLQSAAGIKEKTDLDKLVAANQYVIVPKDVTFNELEPSLATARINDKATGTLYYCYNGKFVGYAELNEKVEKVNKLSAYEPSEYPFEPENKEPSSSAEVSVSANTPKTVITLVILFCIVIVVQLTSKRISNK